MSINLPKPIAAYFTAEKTGDAGALARCFASDGVVHDEALVRGEDCDRTMEHHCSREVSAHGCTARRD